MGTIIYHLRHHFSIIITIIGILVLILFLNLIFKHKQKNPFITEFESRNIVADTLFSAVKILCLINSSKKEIFNRAIHVNATWAQRCNKYVFLTYDENVTLPMLELNVPEVRTRLWDKWRAAFKWAFENELENYDFFLRADDDSYYIMENLRFMLLPYNPEKALIFGCRLRTYIETGYMAGGPGVVLSREALKQLVPASQNSTICPEVLPGEDGVDDIELGACVEKLNILNVDTRDNIGQHRMLIWSPADHFAHGLLPNQSEILYYPYQNDPTKCCAKHIISFHYVYKEQMYAFEFLIYKAQIIGNLNNNFMQHFGGYSNENYLLQQLKHASIALTFNSTFVN